MSELEKYDPNFKTSTASERKDGKDFYTIPNSNFDLYGIFYDEKNKCFCRMPADATALVSPGVSWLSTHTAGGRVRFSTDATLMEIYVAYDRFEPHNHMPLSCSAGFVLIEEGEGRNFHIESMRPTLAGQKGFTGAATLRGGKMRDYILYFPTYNRVTELKLAFNEGAKIQGGKKYRDIKPILYYGSSITQGGCASRPDNAYQAHISKWNNIDYINLGFSGSAKAEDGMVDYLASIDCSLFVCDYDHNAPSVEYLKSTHYRLYERYRASQPNTPILFLSRPDFDVNPAEAKARETVIKSTYQKARGNGDKNVYFLAGRTFYGKENRENFSVDGCHPNDLGFYYMAKGIYKKMKHIDDCFQ